MRELSLEELKAAAAGAVYVDRAEEGVRFHRFTKEQEAVYAATEFGVKPLDTAGIRLRFRTDSRTLTLQALVLPGGSQRRFFAFDILVNGEYYASIQNYPEGELPKPYWNYPFPQGYFDRSLELDEGDKQVEILFPWSAVVILKGCLLADGASFEPLPARKKALFFGDSITHGYDALHPSLTWTARLCRALNLEEINKAIGGEMFFPALAACRDAFSPKCIAVAYGTNDWNKRDRETWLREAAAFFRELCRSYPETPIRVITPIWRGDAEEITAFGRFSELEPALRELTAPYGTIRCISGTDLLPPAASLFSDGYLHPTEEGFAYYAERILPEFEEFREK